MGSVDQGTLFRRATIPIFTFYNYSNYRSLPPYKYKIKDIGDCGLACQLDDNCNAMWYSESSTYLYCHLTHVRGFFDNNIKNFE